MSSSNDLVHLIVGAGVNGINTAVVFKEQSIPFKVFERSNETGGVWNAAANGSANLVSCVQSDPVIYAPPGWYLEDRHSLDASDPLRGIHMTVDAVLANTREIQQENAISVEYGRNVVDCHRNKDGTVTVVWENVDNLEKHVDVFAGIHFRTGKLNKATSPSLPGEEVFTGSSTIGCHGESEKLDMQGKTVIVVGWGPFAVENIVMALTKGAAKVHVVSRSDKPHWFDYATYTARQFYYAESDPNWGPSVWEQLFNINEKASEACGVSDILQSSAVYSKVEGKRTEFVGQGGLPSMSIDPIALGIHYGIVEYHRGEVKMLSKDMVVLSNGDSVHADIVIKCTGFSVELGPLKGHYVHDTIFVDGSSNVTSFHAIDGAEEDVFIGPCIPGTSSYLVSAYPLRDFDRAIIYFMKHPEKFTAFKEFPTFTRIKRVENMGFVSMMHLFNKLFSFGDETIIGYFVKSMTAKREEYEKVLDEQTFLQYDKMRWDAWSELLAFKTKQPLLAYPFTDCMTKN